MSPLTKAYLTWPSKSTLLTRRLTLRSRAPSGKMRSRVGRKRSSGVSAPSPGVSSGLPSWLTAVCAPGSGGPVGAALPAAAAAGVSGAGEEGAAAGVSGAEEEGAAAAGGSGVDAGSVTAGGSAAGASAAGGSLAGGGAAVAGGSTSGGGTARAAGATATAMAAARARRRTSRRSRAGLECGRSSMFRRSGGERSPARRAAPPWSGYGALHQLGYAVEERLALVRTESRRDHLLFGADEVEHRLDTAPAVHLRLAQPRGHVELGLPVVSGEQ